MAIKNKISVVGAGLAGLATVWHLLEAGYKVTLHDRVGIAGGASGVAPGLMHPYGGKLARRAKEADAALAATQELLDVAGVKGRPGILRIPVNEEQRAAFFERSQNADCSWCDQGLIIHSGQTIDIPAYLHALWKICEARGALWEEPSGPTIYCTGAEASPKLKPLKGQVLTLAWPEGLAPPPMTLMRKKYLVVAPDGKTCQVGGTFEREFTHAGPDLEEAKRWILPDIYEMVPELRDAEILDCRAGIRATVAGHFPPLIEQTGPDTWIFAGLGSKGLLYHSLFAKKLTILLGSGLRR